MRHKHLLRIRQAVRFLAVENTIMSYNIVIDTQDNNGRIHIKSFC